LRQRNRPRDAAATLTPQEISSMTVLRWIALALALLALAAAATRWFGAWRWSRLTSDLVARLEAARSAPTPAHYDEARELAGLPPPVQRFFKATLKNGAPIVAATTVRHQGTFNLSEGSEQWKPFTSTQHVVTRRPGFVWDGRVSMVPGLAVHVHDAYVAGEGILHPAIGGLFTLVDLRGGGDVAQGELMRFFAEAAWYPTALLPSQGVRWDAVDDGSAKATLSDGSITLTLLFRFTKDGDMASVRAESRGRTVQGRVTPTPWEGQWSRHAERDGMRVPLSGEVAWLTPEGRRPYWRGTITELRYEFAASVR
jgi:hypothetical protein